jgi:voltage-gated potassium channel
MALAVFLVVLATVIVYLGRDGYRDAAHPGQPLSLLSSAYYATVTLSTIGYGDIVPVSDAARLVNIVLITPIRVIFLVVLIGTTMEVLTRRTRTSWRIARWRSRVADQTVVVGYGTKGRSAVRTLQEAGVPADSIVVVDISPQMMAEANSAGLAGVGGDATRRDVLMRAEIERAARLVVAVGRDDTAVLITLTARQLNPSAAIVAAVREGENEPLLRQSGADHVVVSSDAAGRLLGLSTIRPGAGQVISDLLNRGCSLDLAERPVTPAEVGGPAGGSPSGVIGVLRAGHVLATDDPRAGELREGDRLILVSAAEPPTTEAVATQPAATGHGADRARG